MSKNEQLAEKRSFKGNCEIVRTIFQSRALSFNIPASQKGFISTLSMLYSFAVSYIL